MLHEFLPQDKDGIVITEEKIQKITDKLNQKHDSHANTTQGPTILSKRAAKALSKQPSSNKRNLNYSNRSFKEPEITVLSPAGTPMMHNEHNLSPDAPAIVVDVNDLNGNQDLPN